MCPAGLFSPGDDGGPRMRMPWLGSVWLPLAGGGGGGKHRWRGAFGCTVAGRDGDSATRASKRTPGGEEECFRGALQRRSDGDSATNQQAKPFGLRNICMSSLAPWLLHQSILD